MTDIPAPRPAAAAGRTDPVEGLYAHSTALRDHADRLRADAATLDWTGPQADAFRDRLEALAERCATAADALARSAVRLDRR
ncbi:hypothetical protein ACLF6K_04535 [Streptomyces xanthophaeus]|uniref:hypothetical protein n=1 Tax=Streptomyces xanthophaeus TaxID=67385 RepID=UPI00398FC3AB